MIKLSLCLVAALCLAAPLGTAARERHRRQAAENNDESWWLNTDLNPELALNGILPGVDTPVPAPAPLEANPRPNLDINGISISELGDLLEAEAATSSNCECVPYYQCTDGKIVTNGVDIIDIRSSLRKNDTTSNFECSNLFLDVCCAHPDTAITPIPGPVGEKYVAQCGRRNPIGVNARVSGLTATQGQFGEFPWMTAILQTELVGDAEVTLYVCGGSLIFPDVVLTAAHCVHSWQTTPNILKVRLGEWDTQRTYELYTHADRRVSRVITHENFNAGSLSNDYALLLLESPLKLSPHIDTICLPNENTEIEPSKCFVTGWGKDEFGKVGNFQNILKKVSLPMVNNYDCQNALRTTRLGNFFKLHPTFNCAGGEAGGQDACKGDGGSPLVCPLKNDHKTYVQVGIVAWGIGCGEPGIPGVYGNVIEGMSWINQQLKTLPYNRPV